MEEVVEIIELPEYNAKAQAQVDVEGIRILSAVVDELRTYISAIAAMYNDNHFHSFEHGT